jgi:hypothetical protein
VDKLQTQGSADDVALFLENEQVVGLAGQAFECPVARYINRETGRHVGVSAASIDNIFLEETSAVSRFVRAFDAGRYPELIEGATW